MEKSGLRNNAFLSTLGDGDLALLSPHFKQIDFLIHQKLEASAKSIQLAYFISEGLISVQAKTRSGKSVADIGMIGSEGMVGSAVALGLKETPHSSIVQVGGRGHSIGVPDLWNAMSQSSTLRGAVANFYHILAIQAGQSALSSAAGNTKERLSKWLLMVADRVGTGDLMFTHDLIAKALCTRRPSISDALHTLHDDGLINLAGQKRIQIIGRAGLEIVAHDFYGIAEAEYDRLF